LPVAVDFPQNISLLLCQSRWRAYTIQIFIAGSSDGLLCLSRELFLPITFFALAIRRDFACQSWEFCLPVVGLHDWQGIFLRLASGLRIGIGKFPQCRCWSGFPRLLKKHEKVVAFSCFHCLYFLFALQRFCLGVFAGFFFRCLACVFRRFGCCFCAGFVCCFGFFLAHLAR